MRSLKRRVSIFLAVALVISSISLGFGQLKTEAYIDAAGTGCFRLVITVPQNDSSSNNGTDENFRLDMLNTSGSIVSQSGTISGADSLLNNNTTNTYDANNNGMTSMGAMAVSKTITQARLICITNNNDSWNFSNWVLYYSQDGGASWTQIVNQQWSSNGSGANSTVPVSYFTSNYKTLNFDANGGTGGGTYDAIPGQTVSAPAAPVKAGYTFTGWSPAVPSRMPNAYMACTAQWVTNYRAITFDANGGTGGTSQSLVCGTPLTPPTVTRTGYTFITWSPSVPTTVPNIDKTYTAIWLPNGETNQNLYNISFDPNGGSGTMAAQPITAGQTATLSTNAYTKAGCTFSGWATSQAIANAGVAEYLNGANYTIGISDITLYAVWQANSYTITFDANGGTGGTSSSLLCGAALTAPTVTKTGYTFAGWSPAVPATVPAADTAYTAQWTPKTYTVTFNPQSGTVSPTTSTVTYGSTYGAGTGGFPTPVRTGYTFGGWYTSTSGAGTNILSSTTVTITAAQTLYAKWTANTYTVAYDGNGSTGGSTASSTHSYGTAKALTANGFIKTGYAFTGWAASADGDVVYSDGQSVSNLTQTSGATITLYAKWTNVNVSTITFDANGGSGGKSVTLLIGATLTAPTVAKTGYTLAGWSPSVPTAVPAANTTYTAQWTAITYTVNYFSNGSTGGSTFSSTHTYDVAKALTANGYIKTGYAFTGWATSTDGEVVYTDEQIVTNLAATSGAGVNLYAKWTNVNVSTLTFDANGGRGGKSVTLLIGSTLTAPTVEKTGYTVANWSPAVPATVPAENATYTVQWTANTYTVTYDGNGSTGGSMACSSHAYDVSKNLTLNGFTRTGYNFLGWSTSSTATTAMYTDGQSVVNLTSIANGSITLYAVWSIIQCTITFNTYGGTSVTAITQNYNTSAAKPVDPSKTGYTFAGWYSDEGLTNAVSWPYTLTANATFYAKWANTQYTITFNTNGGSAVPAITQDYGTSVAKPADPTKIGYTFAGWYTDAGLTTAVTWPYTMGALDVNLYAKWTVSTVHFTVSSASGMTGDIITVSVTVSENSNLGAITLVVPYDPAVLEVVSYSAGSILNGFALDVNNNETALKITLAAARTTKLTAGGSILDIQFRIKGSAPAGTINTGAYISELTDTETPANALPFDITQGSITVVCKLGDINGSGTVTAVDALMVLQAATGRITLTAEQMLAADVNKSGTVTALDALMILQYATGKLTSFN